jgi:hypothetical protein
MHAILVLRYGVYFIGSSHSGFGENLGVANRQHGRTPAHLRERERAYLPVDRKPLSAAVEALYGRPCGETEASDAVFAAVFSR